MHHGQARGAVRWFLAGLFLIVGVVSASRSEAPAKKQPAKPGAKAAAPTSPAASIPPESLLTSTAWKNIPTTPLQAGEIDRLLEKEFVASKIRPSPPTTDEQFLRRVRLDLTGQLPTVAEIEQFLADNAPDKRTRLIDKLLASDEYARHWARYWQDTVSAVEAPFAKAHAPAFEQWLAEQFKKNRNWGAIVRDLLTAEGSLKKDDKAPNGALFFLGRHPGPEGDNTRAAETARLFLGIQIQCAECHNDRRTKIWKQVQFHELAGFFARMQVGGSSGSLIKVSSRKFGEHRMPTKDSKQGIQTTPRFLDGKAPPADASDPERRKALADYLTAPDNYWFSAAYVNRIWNELLGQSFYERVDDLSPKSAVISPAVANRLAAAFRGSGYDVKALLRAIVATRAYQRQTRLGDAADQHLRFASVYPARLCGAVLWQSLGGALGRMPGELFGQAAFKAEFDFDPSLKADEVVGSVSQALWMLNSNVVNDRVKVGDVRTVERNGPKVPAKTFTEPSLLKQLLAKHGNDDPALLRSLYLRTLARKPTDRELSICMDHIQETRKAAGKRNEALEDVLKALINSTEFQRKR